MDMCSVVTITAAAGLTESPVESPAEPLELYDSFMIQNQIRKIILRRNATAKFNMATPDILKNNFRSQTHQNF